MAFISDKQRRGFYGNRSNTTYPHAPPQGMLLADSSQITIGGESVKTEKPKKIKHIESPVGRFADTQVMLYKDRVKPTVTVSSPESVAAYVKGMDEFDRELGVVLHLDTKNKVIGKEIVSKGSLNAAIVHPREVFKGAILNNSAGIIFIHNHPSGEPRPSGADIEITRKLKDTGNITGIDLMDSIIIGQDGKFYSMREEQQGGF